LDRVAQQLANNVLEVTEDIWERRIEMAVHFDLWYLHVRAMRAPDELLRGLTTVFNNLFGVAAQEDFADCFLVVQQLGVWKVPWRVEGFGEGQVLLCDDPPRYALRALTCNVAVRGRSYRSQHCGHKLVRLFGLHEPTDLENANGQAGYDGRMLGQGLLQHLAVLLVVFQRANFGHATEALKGAQVRLVDMGKMRVRDDNIGEGLDVAEAVRQSTSFSTVARRCMESSELPRRELQPTVVGRVDQPRLGEGPPEEGQLAEAYGPGFALHPSAVAVNGSRTARHWRRGSYSSSAEDGLHAGATDAPCAHRRAMQWGEIGEEALRKPAQRRAPATKLRRPVIIAGELKWHGEGGCGSTRALPQKGHTRHFLQTGLRWRRRC
jgi:hypothetical protein